LTLAFAFAVNHWVAIYPARDRLTVKYLTAIYPEMSHPLDHHSEESSFLAVVVWIAMAACEVVVFYLNYLCYHPENSCFLMMAVDDLWSLSGKLGTQWRHSKACSVGKLWKPRVEFWKRRQAS
jgi:hypothetical protein